MAEYLAFFEQELRGQPDAFTLSSPSQAQQLQALNRLPWVCAAMGPENTQRLLVPFLVDFQQSMRNRDQILAALAVQWRHVVIAMLGRRCSSSAAAQTYPALAASLLQQDDSCASSSRSSDRKTGGSASRNAQQSADASAARTASFSRNGTAAVATAIGRDRRPASLQQQQLSIEKLAACISLVVKPLEELAAAEEKCVRNEAVVSLLYLLELLPTFSSRQRLVRETLLPVAARLATAESKGFFCRCSAAKLLPALYPYAAAAALDGAALEAAGRGAVAPSAGPAAAAAGGRGSAGAAAASSAATGGKAAHAGGPEGGGGDAAGEGSTSAASPSVPSTEPSSASAGGSSRTEGAHTAAAGGPAGGEGSRNASAVDADMDESSSAAAEIDRAVLRDFFEKLLTHDAVLVKRDAVAEVPSFAKHWIRVRTQQQQEIAAAAAAEKEGGRGGTRTILEDAAPTLLPLHPQGVEDFFFPFLARFSIDSSDFLRCAAVSSLIQLARLYPPATAAAELPGGLAVAGDLVRGGGKSSSSTGNEQGVSTQQQLAVLSSGGAASPPSGPRSAAGAGGAAAEAPSLGSATAGGAGLLFSAHATLPILSSAGGDSSWRVRAVVAKALPHLVPLFKDQLAALFIPLLQQLLRDSALRDVRQEAIKAVGKLAPSLSAAEVSQHLVPLIPILMQENTAAAAAGGPFAGCQPQQQQLSAAAAAAAAGGAAAAGQGYTGATPFFQANATPSSSFLVTTRAGAAAGAGGGSQAAAVWTAAGGGAGHPSAVALGVNSAAAAAFLASGGTQQQPTFSASAAAPNPTTGSVPPAAAAGTPASSAAGLAAASAAGGNNGGTTAAGGAAPCAAAAGGLVGSAGSLAAAAAAEGGGGAGNSGRLLALPSAAAAPAAAGGLAVSPAMPIVAPPTQNSPLIATSPLLLPVIQVALPVARAAGPGGLESIIACLASVLITREELHIRLQIAQEAGEFCRLAAERGDGGAAAAAGGGDSAQQNDKRGGAAGCGDAAAVAAPEALKLVEGLTMLLQTSMGGSDWTLRVEIVRQFSPIAQAFGQRFFAEHLQGVFLQAFADYVYDVREATVDVAQALTECFGWSWAEEVLLPRLKQIYFSSSGGVYGAAPAAAGGSPGSSSSNHQGGSSSSSNVPAAGYGLSTQAPVVSYLERITVLHAIYKLAQVVAPAEVETHLVPFLAAALQDAVPNVKLTGAETIRLMVAADLLPRGNLYTKELLPSLRQLVADGDIDVRFYAQLALMACRG